LVFILFGGGLREEFKEVIHEEVIYPINLSLYSFGTPPVPAMNYEWTMNWFVR